MDDAVGVAEGENRVTEKLINNQSKLEVIVDMVDSLDAALRLTSPFAPFLTEELWQRIPDGLLKDKKPESICLAPYPNAQNVSVS